MVKSEKKKKKIICVLTVLTHSKFHFCTEKYGLKKEKKPWTQIHYEGIKPEPLKEHKTFTVLSKWSTDKHNCYKTT